MCIRDRYNRYRTPYGYSGSPWSNRYAPPYRYPGTSPYNRYSPFYHRRWGWPYNRYRSPYYNPLVGIPGQQTQPQDSGVGAAGPGQQPQDSGFRSYILEAIKNLSTQVAALANKDQQAPGAMEPPPPGASST